MCGSPRTWRARGSCQCEKCRKQNWALAEARTVLAAWKEAQKRRPGLGLRVLTSEATYADNAAVFAEIPREVDIWYYHSLLTYTARKTPMIDGPVLKAAQAGRWMGVCPSLVAHVGVTEPFTSAEFVHYRMSEFTGKGLRGMIGYATPRTLMSRFNVEAAAEWLWNPAGRTPREFTLSWAVREKLRDPEKFVAWAELMGPVEWAIYGSDWPAAEKRTAQESVAKLLAKAKLPELGTFKWDKFGSPWGEFKTPEELKAAAMAAERGVKLARELGLPEFIQESLVIQGYADSLCALVGIEAACDEGRHRPGQTRRRQGAVRQIRTRAGAIAERLAGLGEDCGVRVFAGRPRAADAGNPADHVGADAANRSGVGRVVSMGGNRQHIATT